MLFSSTTFIYLFLPAVLLFYYVICRKSRRAQNIFLLLASLFFYAWGEPKFVLIMLVSIVLNWAIGLLVSKFREKAVARLFIVIDVFLNLALLFVFKYLNFSCDILENLFGRDFGIPIITLPIGISFFTFQAMSYVLDVYREKGVVQKDILCVALYISFFPQLIAGPIVRYETIADEILNRKETISDFGEGFSRFVVGLGKKVLLSNSFALLADAAFTTATDVRTQSIAFLWLGAIAYTLQIFFDFSGYSDMAIGLGRMFGFHFLENFNFPYIATSITAFWRRWHISLGSWFRDYVYFPLGGSRVSKPRAIFNLFIVWTLTGIWHGANFTFVIWGMLYFCLLAIEKLTGFDKKTGKFLNVAKWIYTMFFVIIGWVIFRSDSVAIAGTYIASMFGLNGNVFADAKFATAFKSNILLLIIGIVFCTPVLQTLKKRVKPNLFTDILTIVGLVSLFVLSIINLVGSGYNPFIYFNF